MFKENILIKKQFKSMTILHNFVIIFRLSQGEWQETKLYGKPF